ARSFLPLGVAAWLVLEIWLLTVVADSVGGFGVFLILLTGAVLGAVVIKRAGRRAFQALQDTLRQAQRQEPQSLGAERRRGGNGLTMVGGLLLMTPGLISDLAGLLLIFPPTKALFSAYAERSLERRMNRMPAGGLGGAFQQARIHRPDGKIVQGEVIHHDDAPPASPRDDAGRPPLDR
ncbi:FxsA family membrane protein, partial [Streptomyces sp. GC420]|uniref:FxsA family membrane protein n=1 Tax=Streptomyces sp. GC420 TaxID=2697568 RepID=UPI00141518D1